MPVPTPPYVTIQTGVVTGTILAGRTFSWYNDATSGSCTVTADWCTMPNNVVQAGMSQQATASSVPGNYGYGWFVENSPRRKIYHEGGDPGFAAFEARYPDHHLLILILSNEDDTPVRDTADALAKHILDPGSL